MPALSAAASTLLTVALVLSGCLTSTPSGPQPEAPAVPDPELAGPEGVPSEGDPEPGDSTPDTLPELNGTYLSAEIATVGFDRFTGAPIVLLRELGTGQVVPIWVGTTEARAIAMALHEIEFPRPLTHDLLTRVIEKMGGELEEVVVHDLVDGTYYGLLKLRVEGREAPLLVDTRPSDGLALAARTGAAISISDKILQESPDYEFMAPQESDQVVRLAGLTLVAPTAEHRQELGLPEGPGILVTRATGMAARQGLQRGDLILEANGEPMEAPVDFLSVLEETPVGEPLQLRIWQKGEERTMELYPDRRVPGEEPEGGPKQVA